jgi:hypothetical protein
VLAARLGIPKVGILEPIDKVSDKGDGPDLDCRFGTAKTADFG